MISDFVPPNDQSNLTLYQIITSNNRTKPSEVREALNKKIKMIVLTLSTLNKAKIFSSFCSQKLPKNLKVLPFPTLFDFFKASLKCRLHYTADYYDFVAQVGSFNCIFSTNGSFERL